MKLAPILILCLAIGIQQTRSEPLILDLIGPGIETATGIAQGIIGGVSGAAQGAIGTAGGIAQSAIGVASGAAESGIGAASGAAQGAIGTASGIAQGVVGTATGLAEGAIGTASGIAQGAIGAAGNIGKGVAGIGESILSNVASSASGVVKDVVTKINEVKGKALKGALTKVHDTLQNVQEAAKGALQATEIASKQVASGIAELESKQEESIQEWAENAKNKLADSSEEAQLQGQDLIEGFADQRTEDLKKCSDKIITQLEKLQEKANATAERYRQPMNDLISGIEKVSDIKPTDFRAQAKIAADLSKHLAPLASLPGQALELKGQIVRAGFQNIQKIACVTSTLSKFHHEARRVEHEIDQLVEEDKKNQKNPEEEPEAEEPQPEDAQPEEAQPEEAQPEEDQPEEAQPEDAQPEAPSDEPSNE